MRFLRVRAAVDVMKKIESQALWDDESLGKLRRLPSRALTLILGLAPAPAWLTIYDEAVEAYPELFSE